MRAVLAVLLVGCASDEGSLPAESAHSGTRLELAWFEFPDGQRTWAVDRFSFVPDLVDAMLGVPCAPVRWSDGVERCTPELGGIAFEDPMCTQPVLLSSDRMFFADAQTACQGLQPTGPIYTASDRRRKVSQLFRRGAGGTCEAELIPPGSMVTITEVAETHEPSELLVTLSHQRIGGERIAVELLRGNDNLLVPLRLADTQYDVTCQFASTPGVTRMPCQPAEAMPAQRYADETCREPLVEPQCDKRPPLAEVRAFGCSRYFEVGDERTNVSTFDEQAFSCRPSTTMPVPRAYTLGARVEPAELVHAIEPATSRTQLVYLTHGAARLREPSTLFDSVLDTECTLDPVADNATSVCRPGQLVGDYQTALFADAACTQPLPDMVWIDDRTLCGERPLPSIVSFIDRSYRLGPRHTGEVYDGSNAFCDRVFRTLYELGERVDAMLPVATKRRDP